MCVNHNRFSSVSRAVDFSGGGEVVGLIPKAGLTLEVLKKRETKRYCALCPQSGLETFTRLGW